MPKGVYKHHRSDPIERFSTKYKVDSKGCWVWQEGKIRTGYGIFWDGEKRILAYRWTYLTFIGNIPTGLELDHLCRNRACCNPKHLEPVTRSENGRRGLTGHHRWAEAILITHCPNGHEYNSTNTIVRDTKYGGKSRTCRKCNSLRLKKIYQLKKDERIRYAREYRAKLKAKKA